MIVRLTEDPDEYDYSAIYETIKHYYPAKEPGLTAGDIIKTREYERYSRLLRRNFHDKVYYKEKWKVFKAYLKGGLNSPVRETMVAFYPSYSGACIVEKKTSGNLTYVKELHFFVSLLGPYYSVMGLDRLEVTLPDLERVGGNDIRERNRLYHSRVALTVSPCFEYERSLKALSRLIRSQFPAYCHVPFSLVQRVLTDFTLYAPEEQTNSLIFNALFGRHFPLSANVRGDETFGRDDWLKTR